MKSDVLLVLPIFFLVLLIFPTEQKWFHSYLGPYTVVFKRAEQCPPEMFGKEPYMQITFRDVCTHRHQHYTLSGTITTPIYFNESLDGRLSLSSWSSMGGWKENAFIMNVKSICKNYQMMGRLFWTSLQLNTLGEVIGCSLFPGYYKYANLSLDVQAELQNSRMKQFFYGRWRADAMFVHHKTGEIAGCIRFFIDTVPV